ncbi:hypothetical protein L915_16001 [Phytophthora nicotianae]|uniref:Uncharacterized protein n=1 Tax=Phytophthora nicotianae TaxID=4792 RepID=W2MQB6_PHYNI|nr:hypothetical protein L915_16001 [Phytophthora nicotianae]ETM37684.1 hypothetical protein L914_15829 [Phytophthora nicotianae]
MHLSTPDLYDLNHLYYKARSLYSDDRYINVSVAVAVRAAILKEERRQRRAASSDPVCIRERARDAITLSTKCPPS